MSHVDDGTLHAYLDGALGAEEARRLEGHLAECSACRDRLAEERALRTRAVELLELAAPPERALPPFPRADAARRRPRWWGARLPLAWAATVVLALGVGVYLGSNGVSPRGAAPDALRTEASPAGSAERTRAQPAPALAAETPREGNAPLVRSQRGPVVPQAKASSLARRGASADSLAPVAGAKAVTEPLADAVERAPTPVVAPAAPSVWAQESRPARARETGAPMRRADSLAALVRPQGFSLDSARAVLGRPPLVFPGAPIRALRRAQGAGFSSVVVIDQQLDSATVIELVEGRVGNLRLDAVEVTRAGAARDSGTPVDVPHARPSPRVVAGPRSPLRLEDGLEVTILAPGLSVDSLTELLRRLEPVGR